jgi:hypothetical protein
MPAFNLFWFLVGLALGWIVLPRLSKGLAAKTA